MTIETQEIASELRRTMLLAGTRMLSFQRDVSIEEKGPLDIVTQADRVSENMLTRCVHNILPLDGLISEEGDRTAGRSGYVWHNDPLDGTKNFASGLPFFGISAGRADRNGVPVMGGLFFPGMSEFVFAAKGEGAWTGMGEIWGFARKPFTRNLRNSVVALGLGKEYFHLFEKFKKVCWNVVMLGSCVYESYQLVMKGSCSAYVHTGPMSWDIAAVAIIAKEAGFAVTPVDLRQERMFPFVIAQNEQILRNVLEVCQFRI